MTKEKEMLQNAANSIEGMDIIEAITLDKRKKTKILCHHKRNQDKPYS